MYAVECYGGEYSDKWARVIGVCTTETRAKEYIAEQEELYTRKLKFIEIINRMIPDWENKNPEHRQFDECFKQSIPVPKWNSKNGKFTPKDFGLDDITCDNYFLSVDEENFTYYEVESLD